MIDLHTHSSFSDGVLLPEELVLHAKIMGVSIVALTDHDCTDGFQSFLTACDEQNIRGIRGIELSTEVEGRDAHILGYGIKKYSILQNFLQHKRAYNRNRVISVMEILRQHGIKLNIEEVLSSAGSNPKRVHIIRYLLSQKILLQKVQQVIGKKFSTFNELFEEVLGESGIAYVPGIITSPEEGCELIHNSGGIAVFAHPGIRGIMPSQSFFKAFSKAGIDGIECYYPEHTIEQTDYFLGIAKELGLLVSGGTDFHGEGIHSGVEIGVGFGDFSVPAEQLKPLLERLGI